MAYINPLATELNKNVNPHPFKPVVMNVIQNTMELLTYDNLPEISQQLH